MKKIFHILVFWFMVIALTLFPLSLSRIGVELYFVPQIEIAVAYFLSIYTNVYPIQLFLYGLLIDVAYGNQVGLTAFILLAINKVLSRFKSNLAKQDIMLLLRYFAFTFMITTIFKYIVFSFESGAYMQQHFTYIIINIIVNILFYPFLHYIMRNSHYINYCQTKL